MKSMGLSIALALAAAACGSAQRPDGGEGLLPAGSPVPDLIAPDQSGKSHRISEQRGRPIIVYFYPKDGTPGCTQEACAFRDAWTKFEKENVGVFGVSADDEKSHAQFAKEQKLPFPILADPDHRWSSAFGVPTTMGLDARVSFLIDKSGKVAKVYPNVDPALHADEVLRDAKALK